MKQFFRWSCFILALLGILVLFCLESLPDGKLRVYVLDVGQGDAILIHAPGNERILIDGGPNDKIIGQLSRFIPFYERDIDIVILTHPHADHVNGLVEVLKRYNVKKVLINGIAYNSPGYLAFLTQIQKRRVPVDFVDSKNDFRLGTIILDVLFPFSSLQGQTFINVNNSSIVFRLIHGSKVFYFSGDLEMEKEAELAKMNLDLRSDFIKTGHHGSNTSTTEQLLEKIRPRYAAISCGVNNEFHHPHFATIENLQKRKIKFYRTDLDGTIEVISDGKQLKIDILGK